MKTLKKAIFILAALMLMLSVTHIAKAQNSNMPDNTPILTNHSGVNKNKFYHPFEYKNVGSEVNKLPLDHYTFKSGSEHYFYSQGIYYQSSANGKYKITQPPIGSEVPSLPIEAQLIDINESPYYVSNGVYYDAVIYPTGKITYKVLGVNGIPFENTDYRWPLVGDMIDHLPSGTKKITLGRKTYWMTPDGIFLEKASVNSKEGYTVVAKAEDAGTNKQ